MPMLDWLSRPQYRVHRISTNFSQLRHDQSCSLKESGIVRASLLLQNYNVHPIESYLAKLAEIRASGHATDETSFYPAIEELLSEIGSRMKPRVKPVLQLRNRTADSSRRTNSKRTPSRRTSPSSRPIAAWSK
jgi:hypothetical protein